MLITAKILLTIATLGYSAIPLLFDSNKTHWFNPSWTGHARFHCVWQVMSYCYIGLIALFLIWTAGSDVWPLWIAAFTAGGIYLGFWSAVVLRGVYGGWIVDHVHGVPPFQWNVFGLKFETDANLTLFTPAVLLLARACSRFRRLADRQSRISENQEIQMLTEAQRQEAAESLLKAETTRIVIPQLSKTYPEMQIDDAYDVQRRWAETRIARGARVVGRKIGLTSRAMQIASKMTEPDYGVILDDAIFKDGAQIAAGTFIKPRLETELAFIMGEDLQGPGVRCMMSCGPPNL